MADQNILDFLAENEILIVLLLAFTILYIAMKKGYQFAILSMFIVPGLYWIYVVLYEDWGLWDQIQQDSTNPLSILLLSAPAVLALIAFWTAKTPSARKFGDY